MDNASKKFYIKAVLFLASAIAFSYLVNRFMWLEIRRPIRGGVLYSLVVLLVVAHRPFQNFLIRLPRPHKFILSTLIFLLIVGQSVNLSRTTFPFVIWPMYGQKAESDIVEVFQYIGIDQEGREVTLMLPKLFPPLAHGRLAVGLEHKIKAISQLRKSKEQSLHDTEGIFTNIRLFLAEKRAAPLAERERQLTEILQAIGKMYNHKNPQQPVTSVEMRKWTMDIQSKQKTPAEMLWQVRLQ